MIEYAILVLVVTAAMATMQTYAKRGIQAGIKVAADRIGSQRGGIAETDGGRIWFVKNKSTVNTITATTTTTTDNTVHTVSTTTNSGPPSLSVGGERGQ